MSTPTGDILSPCTFIIGAFTALVAASIALYAVFWGWQGRTCTPMYCQHITGALTMRFPNCFSKNAQKAPTGPAITARLEDKFCGINDVYVSRLPHKIEDPSSWSIVLRVVHVSAVERTSGDDSLLPQIESAWKHVPNTPLSAHGSFHV